MRIPLAALLAIAALAFATPARAIDCTGTSTGLVPLVDLGAGNYQGESGGLYGGGSNARPFAHDLAGIQIAQAIAPLDTFGNADLANGRIVLVSIGMSNCTQEFSTFIQRAGPDAMRNPQTRAVDCAIGGQTASVIANPSAWYWDSVATRLRSRGSSPAQVQVVWLKEANAGPTGDFATSSGLLQRDLAGAVRVLKDELPNVKLVYLSSRIYAGYADTPLNPEPYAYESAFAVRRLIQSQIDGVDSLNFDPDAGPVEAPWLAWGPYLWADGLTPRSDGLTWACSEYANDGTHPGTSARIKVADLLIDFFHTDATAQLWYLQPALVDAPALKPFSVELDASPVPARDHVRFRFAAPAGTAWTLAVYDLAGRAVWRDSGESGGGEPVLRTWRPRASHVAPGVYLARLSTTEWVRSKRVVVR